VSQARISKIEHGEIPGIDGDVVVAEAGGDAQDGSFGG
jgi:hypothetical protein